MSPPPPHSILAALALAMVPAVASAQPAAPPVLTRPDWAALPTEDEIALSYPHSAFARQVGGEAAMRCQVDAGGALTGCGIVRETPQGEGFGQAVLALAPKFRLNAQTLDGKPVAGALITIPVRFTPPTRDQVIDQIAQSISLPSSAPAAAPGVIMVNPKWRKRPGIGDIGRVYPGRARRERQAGQVMMQCGVLPAGRLRDCRVLAENPTGYGFGQAMLKLSPLFQAEVPADSPVDRWRVNIVSTLGFEIVPH